MSFVNLSAVVSPATAARLAAGTAEVGGVVVRDVGTKQVVEWLPAVRQVSTQLCARMGPKGLAAAAVIAAGVGVWAWHRGRKQRKAIAELARQNAALAAENAKLRAGSQVPQDAPAGAHSLTKRVTNDRILAEAFELNDLNDISTSNRPGTVPTPQRADGAA